VIAGACLACEAEFLVISGSVIGLGGRDLLFFALFVVLSGYSSRLRVLCVFVVQFSHSRSATIGFTRAARSAGIRHATKPDKPKTMIVRPSVSGSNGVTP
jgi:hypothetical protein